MPSIDDTDGPGRPGGGARRRAPARSGRWRRDDRQRWSIVGSGPAGLTAAIYAARADLAPDRHRRHHARRPADDHLDVENYPGFPEGIQGPALMARMREQAIRFGSRVIDIDVDAVDLSAAPVPAVDRSGTTYTADAVILATGASALWLGLDSETRCAGAASRPAPRATASSSRAKVAVVGGGDTALEETHVPDALRARGRPHPSTRQPPGQPDHAEPRVRPSQGVVPLGHRGHRGARAGRITGLRLRNVDTAEEATEPFGGLFVAIGHKPNTGVFRDWLPVDEKGYLVVHDHTRTPIEGVFIAGDVHDHRYRQAVTAAGGRLHGRHRCGTLARGAGRHGPHERRRGRPDGGSLIAERPRGRSRTCGPRMRPMTGMGA